MGYKYLLNKHTIQSTFGECLCVFLSVCICFHLLAFGVLVHVRACVRADLLYIHVYVIYNQKRLSVFSKLYSLGKSIFICIAYNFLARNKPFKYS